MPFAVFRRHQRKLLVILGIMAMVGFILSDSISRWGGNAGSRERNRVIAELYGKKVHKSDLDMLASQRIRANRFLMPLMRTPEFFGGLTTRDMVDAYILEHEADRLGIPRNRDLAKTWLKKISNNLMNQALFDSLITAMGPDIDPEQILLDISSQIRLAQAQSLLGSAMVTPLDIFQTFRDQNERCSFKVVSFPVANYTDKIPDPSDSEARRLYENYNDVLPDPSKETPGFKVPHQIKFEVLSVDTSALAKQIEAKLTDSDLRAYYENHKAELTPPRELPDDLFANDPKAALTPPVYRPFAQVRDIILASLSREKAQDEITAKFDKIKDDVINKFSDDYHTVRSEIEDAKKAGEETKLTLPSPTELSAVAKANGFAYEMSPLLTKEEAANYGQVSNANAGSTPSFDDPKFAEVAFDKNSQLYDGLEFSDLAGRRYLVRKMADIEPHVATFDEVKPKVIAAYKIQKARELAKKAAEEALAKVKADGGVIKDAVLLGRPVFAIEGVTRRRSGMGIPGSMQFNDSVPSEIPQLPLAGDKLREALFGLTAGKAILEPNLPKDTYYVATLSRRDPVSFSSLYGPTSSPFSYMVEASRSADREHYGRWMKKLRDDAGLPADWAPPGEIEKPARRA